MYRNTDEIEKIKKIKEDSDREALTVLQQLKTLSESRDSMQQELVELRQVRDAAQEIAETMEIPEGNGDEPLMLAGKLRKLPEAFEVCLCNYPSVRGSCTRVGEVLLAVYSS